MADWAPYFLMWMALIACFACGVWLVRLRRYTVVYCLAAVPLVCSTVLLLVCWYDFARPPVDGVYISAPMRWLLTSDNPSLFENPLAVATRNGLYLVLGGVLAFAILCLIVARKRKKA